MDRGRFAYLLMAIFVIATTVGFGGVDWRLGFIALGFSSGAIGYLIGKD